MMVKHLSDYQLQCPKVYVKKATYIGPAASPFLFADREWFLWAGNFLGYGHLFLMGASWSLS